MATQTTRRRYGAASAPSYTTAGKDQGPSAEYADFSGSPNIGSYQFQNYNPNYNAGGPQTFNPDLTAEDPSRMALQDRTSAYDRGNRLDSDFANEITNRYQMENRYRQPMDSAYAQLYGNPGYNSSEQDSIMREGSMPGALTDAQLQNMYLTEGEQAGMAGDPGSYYNWFNPAQTQGIAENTAGGMNGAVDDWSNASRGAWSGMSGTTRNAISDAKLGPSQDYMNQQDAGINAGEGNVRGALGQYGSQVGASLSGGAGRVRSYTEDPNLGVSGEYTSRMNWTPEDEQNQVTSAATSIGNATRAARDRVEREAAASGNNSALALAAGLGDLQRQGDINAEDEMLKARIGAKQYGNQVAQQREDTRLGAEQTRANLGSQSELALQRAELGAYSDVAGQTSANEQALANRRMGAAGEREGYRSNAEKARMGANLQNEQYLGDSLMNEENTLGNARVQSAYQGGQVQQQANQYNQTQGGQISQTAEQAAAQRAATAAQNRQGVAQYGQNAQYTQGSGNNQALSNRSAGIADARRQGEQEYRGFLASQTAAQQQAQQAARTGRVQAYGTQGNLANQSTQTTAAIKANNPSFFRTLSQSFANSLGRTAGGGS